MLSIALAASAIALPIAFVAIRRDVAPKTVHSAVTIALFGFVALSYAAVPTGIVGMVLRALCLTSAFASLGLEIYREWREHRARKVSR